jgi:tRNA(Ile)-lysidine synthase
VFFFEKKNQKTFAPSLAPRNSKSATYANEQKFFASFFQKRIPSLILPSEFFALMAPLGPWSADRRVAVAVSGGADSLCLAFLAASWGAPLALIVDHGLRAESAIEATETAARLAGFGVPSRILTLRNLRPGPGLAARARTARYAALTEAAAAEGLPDLLVAHHQRDQAETFLMRRQSRSGATGLACMAATVETTALRIVRPLLTVAPARLRDTLRAHGLGWTEDPSNRDQAALRARLRATLDDPAGDGAGTVALAEAAAMHAIARCHADAETAAILAARASIRPEGFSVLRPGAIPPEALAALIRTIAGSPYSPGGPALAALAAAPAPAVLGGVRILPAGRLGPGVLLVREPAAMAPPIAAEPGAVWDRRFRLGSGATPSSGATLGALAQDAPRLRRHTDLPAAVLVTLPAIRMHGALAAVPHIGYPDRRTCACLAVRFSPSMPAAGAPFGAANAEGAIKGMPTGRISPMLGGAASAAA